MSHPVSHVPFSGHHPRVALVTGGAGFIGSNLVRHLLDTHADLTVINLDALTYAGNQQSLSSIQHNSNHVFPKLQIQ